MTTDLNNELTALNEAARAARTLANITRRAETLFESGYTVEQWGEGIGVYFVTSPAATVYTVSHGPQEGFSCTCECFKKVGTCKHLEAVDLMLKEAAMVARAEQEAEYEAWAKEASYRAEAGAYAW